MATIGFFDWAYKTVTGDLPPPVVREGVGNTITQINTFQQDLEKKSKEAWDKASTELTLWNSNEIMQKGETIFTPAFLDDMRKVQPKSILGVKAPFSSEALGRLVETSIPQKGLNYVFNENIAKPGEDKNTPIGKTIGEIQSDLKFADNTQYTAEITKFASGTFIDPYKYWGAPEVVPHTTEITQNIADYNAVKKSGVIDRIKQYLLDNPDKYNIKDISAALDKETNFMRDVQARWDEGSVTKSILEGDAWGTYTGLFGEGIKVTKDGLYEVGEATLGSDFSPVKPLWDLFSDLWENAGSYIEYVFIAVAVFALLWVAGEIKTIVR